MGNKLTNGLLAAILGGVVAVGTVNYCNHRETSEGIDSVQSTVEETNSSVGNLQRGVDSLLDSTDTQGGFQITVYGDNNGIIQASSVYAKDSALVNSTQVVDMNPCTYSPPGDTLPPVATSLGGADIIVKDSIAKDTEGTTTVLDTLPHHYVQLNFGDGSGIAAYQVIQDPDTICKVPEVKND